MISLNDELIRQYFFFFKGAPFGTASIHGRKNLITTVKIGILTVHCRWAWPHPLMGVSLANPKSSPAITSFTCCALNSDRYLLLISSSSSIVFLNHLSTCNILLIPDDIHIQVFQPIKCNLGFAWQLLLRLKNRR